MGKSICVSTIWITWLFFTVLYSIETLGDVQREQPSYIPLFEKKIVENNRLDGYWIDAFRINNDSGLGLLAYGLSSGDISYYSNIHEDDDSVHTTLIQQLDSPVGMDQADISRDGLMDIVICYKYGKTMLDTDPEGGKIIWLENPGDSMGINKWRMHYVGRTTAMHRVKIGHFTQTDRWEIIGLPIVANPNDLISAVPVLLFQEPENASDAEEWHSTVVDQHYFHLIHDAHLFNDGNLDNLVVASKEGISWMYYNRILKHWKIDHLGDGELTQNQQTSYIGTGGVSVGRVQNDSFAYMAAIEPFHGTVVSVYIKNISNTLGKIVWDRYILDVYGYPNQQGEGPAHHITCADLDGDGNDEFLVALRGPSPYQGVYLYKTIDISGAKFSKWKVSEDSAARITIADFDEDGYLDFATISYSVPGYYLAENPSINIFYNRVNQDSSRSSRQIKVTRRNSQLVFEVPRLQQISKYETLPFFAIDGIKFSLEILPPYSSRYLTEKTYIKVISGWITWLDSANEFAGQTRNHTRTKFCERRQVATLEVLSDNRRITTGKDGALLITFETQQTNYQQNRIDDISKVVLQNMLPDSYPQETRAVPFHFVRYDHYDSSEHFKGLEFYNMKGFEINFSDDEEHLCYIQLWAAGQGVSAGVHNHRSDAFCEIHVCLINGSGKGGMDYLNRSEETYDPLVTPDSNFINLPVPSFYEHGPLWDIDAQNRPVLREDGTVVYPWHKWQAGINQSFNQSFDVWIVFEFNNDLSVIETIT